MHQTFTSAIATPASDQWRVLQPPTGTGKTQGLCVYAALTIQKNAEALDKVGILIVTRTIAQAEEIVASVRAILKSGVNMEAIVAKHSETKTTQEEMRAADILVVTHAAYTKALEKLTKATEGNWSSFTHWTFGPRRLTVIDEALSGLVEENQVKAQDVRTLLSYVTPDLRRQFPAPIAALDKILSVLDRIGSLTSECSEQDQSTKARIVWRSIYDGKIAFPVAYTMTELRYAMADLHYDGIALRKASSADRKRIATMVDDTLKNCEGILARWAYYYKKGKEDTFNSSQLLLPSGLRGPVVLDATATQNFFWKLMGDRAVIETIPDGTRSYANVTLHVARGRGLGRGAMEERGEKRLPRLLANLADTLGPNRSVLLCLHKVLEPLALSYQPAFQRYAVAHWGAIDGKNDWNDYDTAVIFGLPYRDQVWSNNMFFALRGLQDNRWLEQPSWGRYDDVRREMGIRQLTVSIIQAINRVRCRRVIDEDGNCPPTDIFIVLPEDQSGDAILSHLRDEMPNIVVKPWSFELVGPKEKVRKGSCHEALLSMMTTRLPGETSMSEIKDQLGLSPAAGKELQAVLRDREHPLTTALSEIGVNYVTVGRGRASRSFLVKHG